MNKRPSVILGSGQFIGVNHLSHEKGDDRANKFKNIDNVIKLISQAKEIGYKGIMFSTHPHSIDIIKQISEDTNLNTSLDIYPNLPYIQKYVTGANELGMIGFLYDMIKRGNTKSLLRASKGVLTKNIFSLIKSLIEIELNPFKKVRMDTIFLHNVLTDMIVSLKLDEILHLYIKYIGENYGVKAGFVTLNFPKLSKYFLQQNIENSIVQAPINKVGFQMNPSLDKNLDAIKNFNGKIIAMSTLAAGYIHPTKAYNFISKLKNIDSIIVGGSSKGHLLETYNLINREYPSW